MLKILIYFTFSFSNNSSYQDDNIEVLVSFYVRRPSVYLSVRPPVNLFFTFFTSLERIGWFQPILAQAVLGEGLSSLFKRRAKFPSNGSSFIIIENVLVSLCGDVKETYMYGFWDSCNSVKSQSKLLCTYLNI